MKKTRAKHSPEFKAKVALAAVQEQETVAAISRPYKVDANQVYKWKQELLENMARVFEPKSEHATADGHSSEREAELLRKIGEITVERNFLFKGLGRFR